MCLFKRLKSNDSLVNSTCDRLEVLLILFDQRTTVCSFNGSDFLFLTDSCCARIKWVITWPLGLLLYCTVPNCVLPRWHRWFMVTFVASTLWIAVFSYLMVWMVRRRELCRADSQGCLTLKQQKTHKLIRKTEKKYIAAIYSMISIVLLLYRGSM